MTDVAGAAVVAGVAVVVALVVAAATTGVVWLGLSYLHRSRK